MTESTAAKKPIDAEQAHAIYNAACNARIKEFLQANKPSVQQEVRASAWDAVIAAVRREYEVELERLREENRGLKAAVLAGVEADAAH